VEAGSNHERSRCAHGQLIAGVLQILGVSSPSVYREWWQFEMSFFPTCLDMVYVWGDSAVKILVYCFLPHYLTPSERALHLRGSCSSYMEGVT
jgi:hypothetical protein